MDSLEINVDIQGQEIAFLYEYGINHDEIWTGKIIDECRTVEENLLATSAEKCLDELVPFLVQLGEVISITSPQPNSPYISKLKRKLLKIRLSQRLQAKV